MCGGIHEITSKERYPDQYLRWEDLRVYAFRRNGIVTISATLRVTGLKGLKNRTENYKEYILNLLPVHMWPEDSFRLLLFTAILDGHIKGINTWTEPMDLVATCDSETGVLLSFKESSSALPLIPSLDHANGVVQQCAAKPDLIPRHLQRLGRLCGFRDILKSHAFRHGAAFALEATCTPDALDVQALTRGLEPQNVTHFGGISLNSVKYTPQSLSPEGEDVVRNHPDIQDAMKTYSNATDALTEKFVSVKAADKESPEYKTYMAPMRPLGSFPLQYTNLP
ncbi:hypothetical protein DTO271D3_7570 [Paecilomyces variotii]|nr:hypothetical protein DTO271D3_7570 [Paecilomyces variotii]